MCLTCERKDKQESRSRAEKKIPSTFLNATQPPPEPHIHPHAESQNSLCIFPALQTNALSCLHTYTQTQPQRCPLVCNLSCWAKPGFKAQGWPYFHCVAACHCSMCVAVFLPLALGVLSVTWPPLASVHSCMGQTAASDITELAGKWSHSLRLDFRLWDTS